MKHFQRPALTLLAFAALTAQAAHNTSPDSDSSARRLPYRASAPLQTDIIHTRLDVSFDWNKSQMNGKAAITAKPYFKPTSKMTLDARGMDIHSVEVYDLSAPAAKQAGMAATNPEMIGSNKLASSYRYENDSIRIDLGREFKADEKYLVKISYTAKPNELKRGGSSAINEDKGLYFINPKGEEKGKMPQIWTQGETQANSAWFPTHDTPNEKMTDEIYMTVDQKYTTLSNGVLADSRTNADGTRTDHWKMDLPHSPYLVMMAVGEFKKVTDDPWNGKEISYYVEKEYEPYAKEIFGNTREMVDFYSRVLGTPYPWAKYSQIVVRDYVSGAMENTSATLHGDFMVYQTHREMLDGKKGEDVIAHELFHQWFGDLATAESWSNLPLNESFATYGEYLWEEYKNGRDAAEAHSYQSRLGYFNQSQQKQVEMIRFNYENREDMFDGFSYNKGGQILHMLRKYVGDEAFFASLKLYLERNRFKAAEIHNLRLAFEEVTGEDLNWFFNEWFLAKGHPQLEIAKRYDAASGLVKLSVKQKQDLKEAPLYKMPVDIDIYSNGRKERHRIVIDQAEQEFSFPAATNPDLVNFDAERQLLSIKSYSRSVAEFIFQYKNAPLFSDRNEALQNLKDKMDQPGVFEMYAWAAEHDNWWELRATAINALNSVAAAREAELKPQFVRMAKQDKSTNIRALAIRFLGKHYTDPALQAIFRDGLKEQSYAIVSNALEAISDPQSALAEARKLEGENNEDVFIAVADVYSRLGTDANSDYFVKAKSYFSAYGYITYLDSYGKFLKRCSSPSSFEAASQIYADLIKNGNAYVKEVAKRSYNEAILKTMKEKQDALKGSDPSGAAALEQEYKKLEELYRTVSKP